MLLQTILQITSSFFFLCCLCSFQWLLLVILGCLHWSTYYLLLHSCWLLLCWEFNPSMTEFTFPSGTSMGLEAARGGLETLWASSLIWNSRHILLSWTGCLRLWRWLSLRLSIMLASTLLFSWEFTLLGTLSLSLCLSFPAFVIIRFSLPFHFLGVFSFC